jgi:hypothetical protein
MRAMRKPLALLFATLMLLVSACSGMTHPHVDMVGDFGNAVRWSDWDAAWSYIDPATRRSLVLPGEEQDRLENIKVTGYQVRSSEPQEDGTLLQQVDIHYIDQATQREKVAHSRQIWRTDDKGEHWWLTTGLPRFEE